MSLKSLATVVTNRAGRQILTVQKHSPAIMFGAGVVGVVATVVLASRATLKLDDVLDEADIKHQKIQQAENASYSENDRQRDLVVLRFQTGAKIAKLYSPAIIVGTLSIAALTGSHITLTRRNVAMTAAYAGLQKAFEQYRERVIGEFGEDKDNQFRYDLVDYEITEQTEKGPVTKIVKKRGPNGYSMYARLFDKNNKNWNPQPNYNSFFVQCQQRYANDLLQSRGHVFLNEVYDMLGMARSRAGCIVGWVKGVGDDYIDFGVFSGDELSGFDFVTGDEKAVWLDFNVDGPIWDNF